MVIKYFGEDCKTNASKQDNMNHFKKTIDKFFPIFPDSDNL